MKNAGCHATTLSIARNAHRRLARGVDAAPPSDSPRARAVVFRSHRANYEHANCEREADEGHEWTLPTEPTPTTPAAARGNIADHERGAPVAKEEQPHQHGERRAEQPSIVSP